MSRIPKTKKHFGTVEGAGRKRAVVEGAGAKARCAALLVNKTKERFRFPGKPHSNRAKSRESSTAASRVRRKITGSAFSASSHHRNTRRITDHFFMEKCVRTVAPTPRRGFLSASIMACRIVKRRISALYRALFSSPSFNPRKPSNPGSLNIGSSTKMSPWMDTNTCARVDLFASHFSSAAPPCHVPSSDRHTFPSAYRLGLKRARPPPVVSRFTIGGWSGYPTGQNASNANAPDS
mmetsp:Transcript_13533/g.57767  ORF Transcript_13533/g.57767 Transcript_13533/m.57767 type:complete len:236 (+) Transcript_13533:576-1283(+)